MTRDRRDTGQSGRRLRGQTTQDFVMGIGIFLIVLTFVIGFFPQVMQPYSGSGAAEASLADRAASSVLSEVVATDAKNDVDSTRAAEFFATELTEDDIYATLVLPDHKSVNVTIQTLDRNGIVEVTNASNTVVALAGGQPYRGESAVVVTRVVTMTDDPGVCKPACRLTVKVW